MATNHRMLIVPALFLIMLFSGCVIFNAEEIKNQGAIISSDMDSAQKLLVFQEQSQLGSFEPNYQNYSDGIGAACTRLEELDSGRSYWTKDAKAVCGNKKGLDNCFFQLERIKTQVRDGDGNINLDSLDVLCSDLRSMGLQANLESFKTKYKAYGAWLNAEKGILAEWNALSAFFENTTTSQLSGAKTSDYYRDYKDGSAKALSSLQGIKSECALKNDFEAASSKVEKICSSVDGYITDLGKADAIVLDAFDFFAQFESGTVAIDSLFIRDCYQVSRDYADLYDLKLVEDTTPSGSNKTDLEPMCASFEELGGIYATLGIPLVFENGELSSSTKTELFKAKTVYVETDSGLGSGVILSSDSTGYYILTNAHVALEYDSSTGSKYAPQYIRVKFYDGRISYADELAYDQEGYDLVVLYVSSSGSYPTASWDPNYYPNPGDKVVAVGNPYGLQFSVSQGTISALRDIGCLTDYCYGAVIQTDTAINPGNSGGGLWDYASGDLLGINSLGLTQAQGLNFAISMYQYDLVKDTFKWFTLQ